MNRHGGKKQSHPAAISGLVRGHAALCVSGGGGGGGLGGGKWGGGRDDESDS